MTTSKLVLSAALILGTLSGALAESWDPVPGDRNPNAEQPALFQGRNLYDVRMQAGRSEPTIYVDTRHNYMDRASQTVDGGW